MGASRIFPRAAGHCRRKGGHSAQLEAGIRPAQREARNLGGCGASTGWHISVLLETLKAHDKNELTVRGSLPGR